MNQPKTLSERLTHGYLLVLRDEETFEERISTRLTFAKIIASVFIIFSILLALAIVISNTLGRTMGSSGNMTQNTIALVEQVDSLEYLAKANEQYVKNLRNILMDSVERAEEEPEKSEISQNGDNIEQLDEVSQIDDEFRTEFEGAGTELTDSKGKEEGLLHELVFFPPVRGIISKNYDVSISHFGIDVVAPKDEPIKAVSKGTVIISSWTQDSGYVIGIQHDNQLISFYKHNSVLLKKVGEFVRAGEPVAIIGNSGEYTDGPHLHFELWYKGDPVNPNAFIKF
ncbi:MAG: M23 family metallopeptidase [Bacteroidota bacterium]